MNDETIKTLLSFIGGAVGLQLLKMLGDRNTNVFTDRVTQRGEWRDEVIRLRDQVSELEKRVDSWQERYYLREQEIAQLKAEHKTCVDTATKQEHRINDLQKQIEDLRLKGVR